MTGPTKPNSLPKPLSRDQLRVVSLSPHPRPDGSICAFEIGDDEDDCVYGSQRDAIYAAVRDEMEFADLMLSTAKRLAQELEAEV